jgi:hypothetical protein
MRLDLTWHGRTSDIPDALWRDCFRPPCQGLFWFRALEKGKLDDQFTFLFGLLQMDGSPIGIVPGFIFDLPLELVIPPALARVLKPFMRGPLRRLAYQRTFFVGNVAGEEGQVGLLPGHALSDVSAFIHDAARAQATALKAPVFVWKEFPDSARTALDGLLATTSAFRMVSYPGTVIPLDRGGYQAFLAKRRSARRWKINDKLRRGADNLPLNTSIIRRPSESELQDIFSLFWQTYIRGKTKFERLTPEFFHTIADCEEATFVVQRDAASGKMLSFMLMLDLGERVINQFIGIDYKAAKEGFLYFRLFATAYDWACTTKAAVLQSGQTGYMAKLDMGHSLVPLWNYCEHRNPLMNLIYRDVASRITWDTLDDQLAEYLKAHPGQRPAS